MKTYLLGAALFFLESQALALPITWDLEDVIFDDGGRLDGFLTFEWPTATNVVVPLDNFSFTTSGGNEVVYPPVTYTPDNISIAFYSANPADPALPPFGRFVFNLDAPTPFGRDRSLRIAPTLPLDGTFSVVPLLNVFDLPLPGGQGREECFSCAPFRLITSGRFVPEPTTLVMVSFGLAGIGFAKRKMKA
jgi:hypothetical protein